MAWTFSEQIHALTGLDAASNSDSETGEDFRVLSAQWLTDAVREVINVLPPKLKQKCLTYTSLTSSTTMDLDGLGDIVYATRENADSGYQVPCREISPQYGGLTEDESSIYYATVTDPVYWITSNASDAGTLFIKPDPSSTQEAHVYHVGNPSIAYNDTSIANFPDEAEYLVPLRAAITALEYKLNFEEDSELYIPMISNLKQEFQQGILALQTGSIIPPKQQGAR
tara:strand:+ start:678 stop:1355 length:678 start_codon:yes stop_codon:yes gene_type:complete